MILDVCWMGRSFDDFDVLFIGCSWELLPLKPWLAPAESLQPSIRGNCLCQMFADHFMHVHTCLLLVIPACLRFTLQQQWWVRDLEGKQLFRANLRCASFTPAWSRIHLVLELSVSTGILKLAAELLVESRAAQGVPNY